MMAFNYISSEQELFTSSNQEYLLSYYQQWVVTLVKQKRYEDIISYKEWLNRLGENFKEDRNFYPIFVKN